MTLEDTPSSAIRETLDQGRQAAEKAGRVLKVGYGAAREYAQENGLEFDLSEFARREPWLAVAAAFAIGYVAARIVKRIS